MAVNNTNPTDKYKRIQGASLSVGSKKYPIFKGINTIGRNKVAIVNIKHLNVSQNQAIITIVDDNQHFISDLNSSNGTYLCKSKLIPFRLYEIIDNSEIQFGDVCSLYKKITGNSVIHINHSEERNELTQNVTQNFYVTDTQLINEVVVDDIHNEPTQVVITSNNSTRNASDTTFDTQFHDAPTQIIDLNVNRNEAVSANTQFHEQPTQIINSNEYKNNDDIQVCEQLPQIAEENENISDTIISQQSTQEMPTEEIQNNDKQTENDGNPVGANESVKVSNRNAIHDSQIPSTSAAQQHLPDDSFNTPSKPGCYDRTIDETYQEELSNESIDLLQNDVSIDNQSEVNGDSTDCSTSSDIVKKRIKPVPKLPCTQLTADSEMSSQDVGCRKKPCRPIDSDSDTDIDEPVCSKKEEPSDENPKANLDVNDLGSDTDCDDLDCIPATQDAFAKALDYQPIKSQNSNHSSSGSFKLGLTELICSQNSEEVKESQNASKEGNNSCPEKSQESDNSKKFTFKKKSHVLNGSLNTALGINKSDSPNKSNLHEESIVEPTQEMLEDFKNICAESTQIIPKNTDDKKLPSQEHNINEDDDDDIINPTQKSEEKTEETQIDALFLEPTQRVDNDDIFIAPTQIIENNAQNVADNDEKETQEIKFEFLKPASKEDSQSTQPVRDDDIFLAPTQVLREDKTQNFGKSQSTNDENIYIAPTQVLDQNETQNDDLPMTQDNLYIQPTQKITTEEIIVESKNNIEEKETEELPISSKVEEKTEAKTTRLETRRKLDKIEEANAISSSDSSKAPQEDTQLEMPFGSQIEIVLTDVSGRPRNPLLSELNKEKQEERSETLSQIEAFVQMPLPKPNLKRATKKASAVERKSKKTELKESSATTNTIRRSRRNQSTNNEADEETATAGEAKRTRLEIKTESICSNDSSKPAQGRRTKKPSSSSKVEKVLDTKTRKNLKRKGDNDRNDEVCSENISNSSENDFETPQFSPAKRSRLRNKTKNEDGVRERSTSSRSDDSISKNPSFTSERSKRNIKPKVVFTMLDNPQLESYIKHLGGSIVDSVSAATVLVTGSVKRSQKLLSAIGQGKPICGPDWIHSSKANRNFLDPWDCILVDKEAEEKWDFSLKESLRRAVNKPLLSNYSFKLMVATAADVLKGAIEASGGKVVSKIPEQSLLDNFYIISTSDQKAKYQRLRKSHPDIKILEPEAVFDGVLRQEFRASKHLIK
ncbi:unnamed protein product [Phyllotreta striolata]|uniref:Mediator of DNA damage checkpoint protein 1 n=1 Tax=Phyllotreta striolata TaxID=444603 RepID=A0A9N9TUC2_PHYSR|nr:unnamed protein product [Phyllotreta striolata]